MKRIILITLLMLTGYAVGRDLLTELFARRANASQPWTPSDITTRAWYDASDADTVFASGSSVTNWNDKSGNSRHLDAFSGTGDISTGTRTIGGLNALDFPAGKRISLASSISGSENTGFIITVFDVDTRSGDSAADFFYMGWDGTDNRLYAGDDESNYGPGNNGVRLGGIPTPDDITWPSEYNNPRILACGRGLGTNGVAFKNGSSLGSDNELQNVDDATSQNLTFGGLDGAYGEIVILLAVPSESDRQKLEGYLAHKWGIEGSLPADHPYKSTAPTK